MNAFKLVLLVTLLTSLSGCLPLIAANALIPQKKESKSETHRRPLETTQQSATKFYRKKQMVTVYDCNGHVKSHSVKTVSKNLSKTFTINFEGRKKAWKQKILNRRNGSNPVFPSRREGQFTVDYSPTLNHIRVSKGINEIEYVFYKCENIVTKPDGTQKCGSKLIVEKEGIYRLDIDYEVINLPGESEVHPAPGSCPVN